VIQIHPAARIAVACSVFSTTPGHGLGIEFTYHDPEVVARGNAGVASADGASAVYYNPAMLGTGDGSELLLAGYVLDYHIEHDGPGGHSEMEDGPAVAASAFAMTPLGEKASLGFGLYSPFGQKNEWSDNSPLRALATETELLFVAGTAALGVEVTPGLRLGISASAVSSSADLNRGIVVPGDQFSLEGDGHGWGLGAGYRTECWAAELTYQFGYGNSREITGGLPTLSGSVADGKMTYRAHGLSMGARWFF
jgi:long-chain fatty acid transport protein